MIKMLFHIQNLSHFNILSIPIHKLGFNLALMLHFQYLEYLLVLLALPIIIISFTYVVRWKKKTAKKIGDPELVKSLTAEYSPKKFRIKYLLIIAAFILCAFAVAGLVLPDSTQRISRNGTDLIIALDVSKSMLANDIQPNRLERAKQLITKVIDKMPDERIGLIIFAGRAYLQMPLTIDHSAAKMYVTATSTNDVPTQGTVISQALRMSLAAFNPQDKSYKSVLLISDGEDHDQDAVKAAKELAKQGIMVNTVGIGSPMGAPIPDEITGQYKTDKEGKTVISKLNEQELENIANATHGIYQLYTDPDVIVKNLKNQLSGIEKGDRLSDSSYLSLKQYYWYFLVAAFILLFFEMMMSEKRKRTVKTAMMIVLLVGAGMQTTAQSVKESIRQGNQSYNEGKYDQAEKDYRTALEQSDKNDIANFNLGNALFRQNDLEGAAKSFDLAIQNTNNNSIKQQAYYNKGVSYQKAEKLPECILSYKNALLLNPNDEAARQNLQRALKKQKEQQQQQNKDKKDQDKNKDKKKQNQDQQKQDKDQPKQQQSKLTKKEAEEKLKALADKEKELQDKLHKVKGTSSDNPEKDW